MKRFFFILFVLFVLVLSTVSYTHLDVYKRQGFALVVVVLVRAWGLVVNFTALDKVVVVERSGAYLKTHAEDSLSLIHILSLISFVRPERSG